MGGAAGGGRVDATWRLGRVSSHLLSAVPSAVVDSDRRAEEQHQQCVYDGGFIVTSLLKPPPPPSSLEPPPNSPAVGLNDEQLAGYVARGFINLPRELIGLDPEHHRRVHAHHRAGRLAHGTAGHPYASWKGDNIFNHMDANPEVLEVINSPTLVAAVGSILGPDWAIVPYANSVIEADAGDQHWCGATLSLSIARAFDRACTSYVTAAALSQAQRRHLSVECPQTRVAPAPLRAPQSILLPTRCYGTYGPYSNGSVLALLDSRSRRKQCKHLHRNASPVRRVALSLLSIFTASPCWRWTCLYDSLMIWCCGCAFSASV